MLAPRRHLFDIPRDVAYLNTAYLGPLPKVAIEAGRAAAERKAHPWTITAADFFDGVEVVRARAAALFDAEADAIAITPSVSYGMATAAGAIALAAGQEILLLAQQFPSNVYQWRRKAAETGARLRMLERPAGASWTEALLAAIGPQTGLVACAHTHWIDGGLIDVETVGKAARAVGAAFVLDLTQSLGALPFSVKAAQPDFAMAAAYKWLLGPYGLAFLYVAPHRRNGRPLEESWANRAGAENFARLVDYADDYAPGARRYDMGERSSFNIVPVAAAALEVVGALGPANLSQALASATTEIVARVARLGLTDSPHRAPHYLGLALPTDAPADLAQRLAARKVYVSQRGDRLRVTPHLNVDAEDLDRFEAALAHALL